MNVEHRSTTFLTFLFLLLCRLQLSVGQYTSSPGVKKNKVNAEFSNLTVDYGNVIHEVDIDLNQETKFLRIVVNIEDAPTGLLVGLVTRKDRDLKKNAQGIFFDGRRAHYRVHFPETFAVGQHTFYIKYAPESIINAEFELAYSSLTRMRISTMPFFMDKPVGVVAITEDGNNHNVVIMVEVFDENELTQEFTGICDDIRYKCDEGFDCVEQDEKSYGVGYCKDIDECEDPTSCDRNLYCRNVKGGHYCDACIPGTVMCGNDKECVYSDTEEMHICIDVNECELHKYSCPNIEPDCVNKSPGYICNCSDSSCPFDHICIETNTDGKMSCVNLLGLFRDTRNNDCFLDAFSEPETVAVDSGGATPYVRIAPRLDIPLGLEESGGEEEKTGEEEQVEDPPPDDSVQSGGPSGAQSGGPSGAQSHPGGFTPPGKEEITPTLFEEEESKSTTTPSPPGKSSTKRVSRLANDFQPLVETEGEAVLVDTRAEMIRSLIDFYMT